MRPKRERSGEGECMLLTSDMMLMTFDYRLFWMHQIVKLSLVTVLIYVLYLLYRTII